MNNKILFFLLGLCFSCGNAPQTETTDHSAIVPDWLLGSWQRTNDEEGKTTFEHWEKIGPENYQGLGYTMAEADTVFQEQLQIKKVNGNWVLEVSGVHEQAMPFEFTRLTANSFVAENPENEFPKRITYTYDGSELIAEVSAGEMAIDFRFEKIND